MPVTLRSPAQPLLKHFAAQPQGVYCLGVGDVVVVNGEGKSVLVVEVIKQQLLLGTAIELHLIVVFALPVQVAG